MPTINISYLVVRCKFRDKGVNIAAVLSESSQPVHYHLYLADTSINQNTIKPLIISGLSAGNTNLQMNLASWITIDEIGLVETIAPKQDKYLYVDVVFNSLEAFQSFFAAAARNNSVYAFSMQNHSYRMQSLFPAAQELQETKIRQLRQELVRLKENSKSSFLSTDFLQNLRSGIMSSSGGILNTVKSVAKEVLQQPEVTQVVKKLVEQKEASQKALSNADLQQGVQNVQSLADQAGGTVKKTAEKVATDFLNNPDIKKQAIDLISSIVNNSMKK